MSEQAPRPAGREHSSRKADPRAHATNENTVRAPTARKRTHAARGALGAAANGAVPTSSAAGASEAVRHAVPVALSHASTGDALPPPPPQRLSPSALRVEDLVALLRAHGSKSASAELLNADIDAGAPTNADGTVNFIHYAAWLELAGD